jgi:hypothetical protein
MFMCTHPHLHPHPYPQVDRKGGYFVTVAFNSCRSKHLTTMISNYNRNLEYKQPLLVLRSRLQPMGSSRFNFNFPPPLDIPFVSKSLILGMTLHIATNPSVGRINRIIDFIKSLPDHLSLYGGFSHDDWIKLFAAPTFFIYVEKDGVILSAMSIVRWFQPKTMSS